MGCWLRVSGRLGGCGFGREGAGDGAIGREGVALANMESRSANPLEGVSSLCGAAGDWCPFKAPSRLAIEFEAGVELEAAGWILENSLSSIGDPAPLFE